ncbi:MAG: hypothetical protein ACKVOJ_01290 [Sphingomonadaceae bacterium]
MEMQAKSACGALVIAELREFASFEAEEQRYIRRALDIAFERADAELVWARNEIEATNIRLQICVYRSLPYLRSAVPQDIGIAMLVPFMAPLVRTTLFDLGQGRICSFSAYRFLYERLIGAKARPWLPSAFCAAASLPDLSPRKRADLIQSISESAMTAPGWSDIEPNVYPGSIDES